jgi:O-antigen/teichoic acid export membrane protein
MASDAPALPQPGRKMPRLLADSTLYFAGNVASRAVSVLMLPFYGRHLSPTQYGILSLIELSITVIAIVFGLQSIGQTLTRIYHDQTEDAQKRAVVSTALLASLLGAILVAALAIACAGPIARGIALPDQVALLRAGFVAMAFSTAAEIVLVYHRILGRARFFLIYSMVNLAATVALNIWFIGVLHWGVWGFVSSKLIVSGAGGLYLMIDAFRDVGVTWARRHASAMARFGGPLVLSSIGYYAIHFSDRLFLAHVSKEDVGIYSMAYNFAFLLSVLVGDSFDKSWNVSFYSYAGSQGWQEKFVHIGTWLFYVLAAAAVAISLFGRDMLIVLLPASYIPPLLMLPVLLLGYFFREIGDFFRNILLIGMGSGLVGRIALAGAAVNLVLNWLLISGPLGMGIWGAVAATTLTWGLYCATCWVAAWRAHSVKLSFWPLARLAAFSIAILAGQSFLRTGHPYTQLVADAAWLLVFAAGSAAIYLKAEHRREAWALASAAFGTLGGKKAGGHEAIPPGPPGLT